MLPIRHIRALFGATTCFLVLSACHREVEPFSKISEDFVYGSLALSPVGATAQGYHRHQGVDLDKILDDASREAADRARTFYISINSRLKAQNRDKLSPDERADADIISDQIALALFDLDLVSSWRFNPTTYVELVGNAFFVPYVEKYAPEYERFQHITQRLEKLPAFLNQARQNLRAAPAVWDRVAQEENQGNIDLIDKEIRPHVPAAQKDAYNQAAKPALEALKSFQEFLARDLSRRSGPDWRLGAERYKLKFRLALGTDLPPDEVLSRAESDLQKVRAHMLELSLPLHHKMFPTHGDHADLKDEERQNLLIGETLRRVSDHRSTRARYLDDARQDLAEARDFVQEKDLLTLPSRDNLEVIPTPVFMRGAYGVGGFNSAPVLQPELGAYYWVTPIDPTWPDSRAESKLREYNFFKLKLLTIHEAMPGHYVQAEVANNIMPPERRVLRGVYGNTPYVEGWAQYATQTMLDQGFLDNSPELRLTFLKEELRVLANAIMDIRLQTNRMTDQEALDLMQKRTFQEHEEAVAKLQRAQLSSCQLPSYLVGWRDWIRVRDHYRVVKGNVFQLKQFHDAALRAGAVPLPVLARLLTGKALGKD